MRSFIRFPFRETSVAGWKAAYRRVSQAAMVGKTKIVISQVNHNVVYIRIPMCVSGRNRMRPEPSLWSEVIEATHAPFIIKNEAQHET